MQYVKHGPQTHWTTICVIKSQNNFPSCKIMHKLANKSMLRVKAHCVPLWQL